MDPFFRVYSKHIRYRVGCDSVFPSPDASFYDPNTKKQINFEFKPDTETAKEEFSQA